MVRITSALMFLCGSGCLSPCAHLCIIVFLVPSDCPTCRAPRAPGGSPARRQPTWPGQERAASCRASEVCWLALNCGCWRWKSICLFQSLSLSASLCLPLTHSLTHPLSLPLSPLQPPEHSSSSPLTLFMFTGRKSK